MHSVMLSFKIIVLLATNRVPKKSSDTIGKHLLAIPSKDNMSFNKISEMVDWSMFSENNSNQEENAYGCWI